MDQFGVTKPELKAIARTPRLPAEATADSTPSDRDPQVRNWLGVSVRNIVGQDEMSAFGLPGVTGALIVAIPADHAFAKAGLRKGDVILALGDQAVDQVQDLFKLYKGRKRRSNSKSSRVSQSNRYYRANSLHDSVRLIIH